MPTDKKIDGQFEIHASIVFQLGESLISNVFQALAELAKNSYDADATYADITIDTNSPPPAGSSFPEAQGYISISDDGDGMDLDTIKSGWLTISNSLKKQMKSRGETTKRGRTPLGDKGLGRLGVQRLGENIEIVTRPKGEKFDIVLAFSWSQFRNEGELSKVHFQILQRDIAKRQKGTQIIISDIRQPGQWTEAGAEKKVQEELSKIVSPFAEIRDFNLSATLQGKKVDLLEVSNRVRSAAQVRYSFKYVDGLFTIDGQSSLNFLKTADNISEVKRLVERDNGKKFLAWLAKSKKATAVGLKPSKQKKWLLDFGVETRLEEMDGHAITADKEIANPGNFFGEVDFFDFGLDGGKPTIFEKAKDFKDLIKSHSGIRVYRDGFGIRLDQDWLGLGSQWTSATSYYGLKPQNTLGYVSISAKENSCLEEMTDREGFKSSPHYENFKKLLEEFVKYAQKAQGIVRREFNSFKEAAQEERAKLPKEATATEIFEQADKRLGAAERLVVPVQETMHRVRLLQEESREALKLASSDSKKEVQGAQVKLKHVIGQLAEVSGSMEKIDKFLNETKEIRTNNKVIRVRFENLQQQMTQLYEAVSLGLTVEAFTHELNNVLDAITYRTKKIETVVAGSETPDKKLEKYFEFIRVSVAALRKQLAYLAPSLKYVRDKKEKIDVQRYLDELQKYYHARFSSKGIELLLDYKSKDFNVLISRGKLNQVIENLFANSEYWLVEDLRTGKLRAGKITIEVDRPFLRVADNGRGISSSIEPVVFEPFQTTKRRGEGRGLGLFIISQLLISENCSISLLEKKNKAGRPYTFEIDLTGVVEGNVD